MLKAKLNNGWVCCPYCTFKPFPIGKAKIESLDWKCKKCKQHYLINLGGKNGKEEKE
jgi:ssDNA-binding Zn-finger/Zn-ribbon topoisomerase 1